MNLFNKKDNEKYDIDPKDNIPREVYGIPKYMNKKYDIEPEDNIPQKVYGVLNIDDIKPTNITSIKESIKINIRDEKNNYILSINYSKNLDSYDLLFADLNNLGGKVITDLPISVSEKNYIDFKIKIDSITNDWEGTYFGDSNVSWDIKIDTQNKQKTISGKGGYPKNWNKLIDLLSEYERLFKVSKGN